MFTNKLTKILYMVVLMVVLPLTAYAQNPAPCRDRDKAISYLENVHGEELVFRGISTRGHVTLIHFNSNTGEWTASIIRTQNPTLLCGVDNGGTGEIMANGDGSTLKKKKKTW
tara:strand:+ start:100 stop:438 length:339 start_codon:yes stop_codon:yes gene_type:complete